jgi:hypothetical protein
VSTIRASASPSTISTHDAESSLIRSAPSVMLKISSSFQCWEHPLSTATIDSDSVRSIG